jgi:chromosome segregation protein
MKFSRLKLHGFKSFSDEMTLVMEPGLTGIVGPNGCGKSNLVEAMRWVMGESSYKAMRASGMDDVIFSGSGNRPARNSAEVTLVLDNADRTAPAALNNSDILEVTRRIERAAGSVYRVNGREVRARDVQLLFADASTGAHSPAMVRQGQIGELIAAKPTARRALLEEAAGISGLHSRRHEAELRLRAAESNLERVDDVIAQIETQLETLKRQARLALRYRALSGDIRRAEASLYHIRWVAARFAENEADAQQAVLLRALADAMHSHQAAQKQAEAAETALQPLREREAVTGAVLQRYTILAEQLAEEVKRAGERRAELQNRAAQLDNDSARERQLVLESETTLRALEQERAALQAEAGAAQEDYQSARAEADAARAEVTHAEGLARAAGDQLAELRAHRMQAQLLLSDAAARLDKLRGQMRTVESEATGLERQLAAGADIESKQALLEQARAAALSAETASLAADEANSAAEAALDAARPGLAEIEATLNRLEAEASTLSKMLQGASGQWPAIVDELAVEPGYEAALGAALGNDLEASSDSAAPIHWAVELDSSDDPALPQAAEPLSRYVTGSPLLKRRLDQIGLVSAGEAAALLHALKPGQRLVTLEGALWRWDGLVAAADAPSAAAQRLAQRNRLAELDEEIAHARGEHNSSKRQMELLAAHLETSRNDQREQREKWRLAQHAIGAAQAELDKAQRAVGNLRTRQSALNEARQRLSASIAEATALRETAEAGLAQARSEADAEVQAEREQSRLAAVREKAERARLHLGGLENTTRLRDTRLTQIGRDSQAWQRRRDSATEQLATLEQRRATVLAELAAAGETPDGLAARRQQLDAQLDQARAEHKAAGDAHSVAQTRYRDADKALKSAGDLLANARVELTRAEERAKSFIAQRQQIERQIEETLGIPAARTLEVSGIRPEEPLPAEAATEQKVERLKAERERLGGVNLSAEKEAGEVQQRLDTLVADRNDLIEAIAKLRTGIQQLNREGRARLNEAFGKVNERFQELFTGLFGGGTAELSFVESDDPLEAGLEIIARPPGKKPQTMTLLSGGEQALTAMSLIFAVFLTNPAPICVLDEVDAPLDDANVERFCNLLDSMRQRTNTRFMVITHNPITMSRVDRLFGVTMAERGVSQLVSVDLQTAAQFREAG